MKSNRPYEFRSTIKWFLIIGWFMLIAGTFWYTHWIIETLKKENRENLFFQLKTYERAINSDTAEDAGFMFTEIIQDAEFPIILTDALGDITGWRNIPGIPDSLEISTEIELQLKDILQEMALDHPPIEIRFDNFILSKFYFGEPPIVTRLRWLPIWEALIVTAFILLGYLGFSVIRNHEQNLMWVGMAKETAHQLGTPLSSLMGWITILREDKKTPEKPVSEIEKDVERLQRVANRFSKIGSKPTLKKVNLDQVLCDTKTYFEKRLPQMGKNINISVNTPKDLQTLGNEDLLLWVFENLIKNSIDSIETKKGEISIAVATEGNHIKILIEDNGSGMSSATQKIAFKPGYSTKKRGWGLGLTLVKRIVEDYHGGRIRILDSIPGRGTQMQISLLLFKDLGYRPNEN